MTLGYGKAFFDLEQRSSALTMFDRAVERFGKRVLDSSEDADYRIDCIESLLAREELRWSQAETTAATAAWQRASEQFSKLSGVCVSTRQLEALQTILESLPDRRQE